jgi:hypothetical protein
MVVVWYTIHYQMLLLRSNQLLPSVGVWSTRYLPTVNPRTTPLLPTVWSTPYQLLPFGPFVTDQIHLEIQQLHKKQAQHPTFLPTFWTPFFNIFKSFSSGSSSSSLR